MSDVHSEPTFDFEKHELSSITCGLDTVDLPPSLKRPVNIAVYGHPRFNLIFPSSVTLNIVTIVLIIGMRAVVSDSRLSTRGRNTTRSSSCPTMAKRQRRRGRRRSAIENRVTTQKAMRNTTMR